jgi:hypothetical protein
MKIHHLRWLLALPLSIVSTFSSVPSEAGAKPDPMATTGDQSKPVEDERPRLRGDELREAIPDLKTRDSPPSVWVTPFFGGHVPYQVGVGASVDVLPLPWLHVGALYSFGISPGKEVRASHYGEALVGVAISSSSRETLLDLPTKTVFSPKSEPLAALVPSYHGFFVEGGVLTGFIGPARCVANCDPLFTTGRQLVSDDRQLFMPFGGFRYLYFYDVSSERQGFRRKALLQVYGHLFYRPFNAPDHDIVKWNGDRVDQATWGGRVGIDLPPLGSCIAELLLGAKCIQGGLALGYNPVPAFLFFEFHFSYPIY